MMHRATLTLTDMPDMERVLSPETYEEIPRSRVRIRAEGRDLLIEVEAEDITALRAAISSYLRWISAAMSAKNVMEE